MAASFSSQSLLNEDAGISPLLLEQADRITEIITFMAQKGFSFNTFLIAFLDNPTPRVRRKATRFIGKGGGFINFISKVLESSSFARGARDPSAQAIQDFEEGIGESLVDWFIRLLSKEAKVLSKHPGSRLAPVDLTPDHATNFDIEAIYRHHQVVAPVLHKVISALCLVNDQNGDAEAEGDDPGLEDPETVNSKQTAKISKKEIISTAVIAQMMFSRTNRANALQTMIGYYLAATNTSKNTISVLNYLGISISYSSIIKATSACAAASRIALRDAVAAGVAVGGFWDNMTMSQRVGEETTTNRHEFLNWTARGAWQLRPPTACPLEWEKSKGWEDLERLGPGTLTMSEEPYPMDIDNYSTGNDSASAEKKFRQCLDRRELFRDVKTADLNNLDLLEVLRLEQLEAYWVETAIGHVSRVLWEFCGSGTLRFRKVEYPAVPTMYRIPVHASKIWTLPTLEIDESTLDGNAQLMEEFLTSIGVEPERMAERSTLLAGDLMSVNRANGVIQLRKRDLPEHRMDWAITVNGQLHTGMTSASAVVECNGGRSDGRDPSSMRRIAAVLGRNKVFDSKNVKDYSSMHRFIHQTWKAHVLVGAIELASREHESIVNLGTMQAWLEEDPTRLGELAQKVVLEYMGPKKVTGMRRRGEEIGVKYWEDMMEQLRVSLATKACTGSGSKSSTSTQGTKGRSGRGRVPKSSSNLLEVSEYSTIGSLTKARTAIIKEVGRRQRDISYENFCLTLVHGGMYVDFYDAVRAGDSGRLERSLDMHTIFFFGCGRWNYARELLDLQVDRKLYWSDPMRGIWLNNILLNLSGSENTFMGIDEANEYVVRELKDGYNPKGTIQSKTHLMDTISPNIFGYMGVRRAIPQSFGIPWGGTSHSQVDDRRDIGLIVDLLLTEKVARFDAEGRWFTGTRTNPVEIQPGIDAFGEGIKALSSGMPLANAVHRRSRGTMGTQASDVENNTEEFYNDGSNLCEGLVT
ncbi:hypothetical protein BDZ91DRAFT_833164 [Kalaharituber pfeilii]|nr:hypothetical protein BDZ91DRAFT_833164 [Kalaharituber pfeilii]